MEILARKDAINHHKDAINRRQDERMIIVETAIHRVSCINRTVLGWAYRVKTQQSTENVGFRCSTQPTQVKVFD